MKGRQLEQIKFRHPLYARDSVAVLADYVTLEQGTGAVHTAPGHGSDDFATGMTRAIHCLRIHVEPKTNAQSFSFTPKSSQ
jgi:isoleucyl-tRNA synthetase